MESKWLREGSRKRAVVFVHGILSSGESCWLSPSGAYWPRLVEQTPELEDVKIYVYTYRTDIFSKNYRLSDIVDDLKEHLRFDRVLQSDQIIFVCHSMGGIAVRKFLVERANDLIDSDIEVGLFLLGSPSLGSSYANWLSPLAQFFGHAQADALRFTQRNAWLNDLDKEFQNLKESRRLRIRGKELVEDEFVVFKKFLKKQIVEPFSGARYFGEPLKVAKSDHFSIAKPEGPDALQHRVLIQFLADMRQESQGKGIKKFSLPEVPLATEKDTTDVPELVVDWRPAEVDDHDLRAFLEEALYRAEHDQKPCFELSLLPLRKARNNLATIDAKPSPTSAERIQRVEAVRLIEYFEHKQRALNHCFAFILSEDARRKAGWGLMSRDYMALVAKELLTDPRPEGLIKVLLINHSQRLQGVLYMERERVESNFKCSLSKTDSFLSVLDCPSPIDVAEADWETMWRALAAILRTTMERDIDPNANVNAMHMNNWVLSPD